MQSTQINLRTLKAVALAASNEETRFYLNGVLVECRETTVTYVATDDHRMLVAQEDLPELEEGETRFVGDLIIPNETIKAVKVKSSRFTSEADKSPMRALEGGRFELVAASLLFSPIDGTFPEWGRVVPREQETLKEGAPIAQFNPLYVASFGKFAEMMGWPVVSPHIHHTGYGDPHAITFGSEHRAFGVLMPVRNHADTWPGCPAWANQRALNPALMAAE